MFKRLPSPAMVVACTALVLSCGGVGYAATVLPANSVGSGQLKRSAVTASDLRNRSVTPAKLHPKTVAMLKGAQGPTGEPGPKGEQGPKGEPGVSAPPVAAPTVRVYATQEKTLADSVPTLIGFDAEDYDAFAMHDPAAPSELIAPKSGTYLITAAATFAANSSGIRAILVAKPGTSGVAAAAPALGGGLGGMVETTTQMRLQAGEKVQFRAFQNSGGTLALEPANSAPYTSIHAEMTWLAP